MQNSENEQALNAVPGMFFSTYEKCLLVFMLNHVEIILHHAELLKKCIIRYVQKVLNSAKLY